MILKADKTAAESIVVPEVGSVLLVAVIEVSRGCSCAALHEKLTEAQRTWIRAQEAQQCLHIAQCTLPSMPQNRIVAPVLREGRCRLAEMLAGEHLRLTSSGEKGRGRRPWKSDSMKRSL